MRKTILTALLFMAFATVHAQALEPQYTPEDSLKAVTIMRNALRQPAGANLIIYIAEQLKGIPYVAHTLEPNDTERLIVNLRQLDCTTFVEQVAALYLCVSARKTTFSDFCHELQQLRYEKGAVPHYTKRLHYYTSWIEDKQEMNICKEIQTPAPPFTATQKLSINWMTTHVGDYRMLKNNPSWIPQIRKMEQKLEGKKYKYIPKSQVKNTKLLRSTIKNGDIIAIITNKKGLDTQHLGFALWHDDGLHLLNASSIRKKVVDEPLTLRAYLYQRSSMPGIRIIRLNDK